MNTQFRLSPEGKKRLKDLQDRHIDVCQSKLGYSTIFTAGMDHFEAKVKKAEEKSAKLQAKKSAVKVLKAQKPTETPTKKSGKGK